MKPIEYINRNLKGFEGDEILAQYIQALVKKHKVKTIIETGTYLGGTTVRFAEMADLVITIESNPEYQSKSYQERLQKFPNIWSILAHSQNCLWEVIQKVSDPLLFFLDAHWENHCPLLDEMAHIAKAGIKPVIVIHDFYNPDKPDFGFDTYNGQRLDFAFIADAVSDIYGDDYTATYNTHAEGAQRGVIFIEPGKRRRARAK